MRTDSNSRAEIRAGSVGRIDVAPGSIVRLVQSGGERHRLALDRGRIEVRLWSPPFAFSFATPAGIVFDVGCAFSLQAGEDGRDIVHVTSGWVQFQSGDRKELIPAGATAVARRGRGPGTPFFDDADEAFKAALLELDFGAPAAHESSLRTLLTHARKRDVYTLLRFSLDASASERASIYQRASALSAPPASLTRDAFVGGRGDFLDEWTQTLGLGGPKHWWVHWRDAL